MIKHIFLLSLRNFFKNKVYSLAIILSLALGFSISNVLIGFTFRELNTDSFHAKKDRIFRLVCEDPFGRDGMMSFMKSPVPEYLEDNYAEIEATTVVNTLRYNGISKEGSPDSFYDLTILLTDSSFLKIFDFDLMEGNPEYSAGPGKMILTEESSRLLFNHSSPFTRSANISIDSSKIPLEISDIIEGSIENSHLVFDGLVYYSDFIDEQAGISYILLNKGIHPEEFISKINNDASMPSVLGPGKINYHLQELEDIYFDEGNTRNFSKARGKLFLWISWAVTLTILSLAGFNFLNLFFNAFLKRWKEFGMKKVLGAALRTFRLTAIFEVSVYIIISFFLSLLITYTFLPWFNAVIATDLTINYLSDLRIVLLAGVVILVIAILVILKLSNYMFSINPVSIFNQRSPLKSGFNRYMLGFQFVISVMLLVCAITIIRQTNFIQEKPLGFNRDILEVRAPRGAEMGQMEVLQNYVNAIPGIKQSSLGSGNPISDNMILRYDLENDEFYTPYLFVGDENYLETLGIVLLSGQIPSIGNTNAKLVNEAFIKYFDLKEPIGKGVPGTEEEYISGVVRDFNISSLKQDIPPTIISINSHASTLLAKIDPEQVGRILPEFKKYWKMVYPSYPFKYLLMDDELAKKHKNDLVLGKIIITSAIISILITCFGLFALSWGTAQERSREIGIRKVTGANSINILRLLLAGYLKILAVSLIIGIPLSIYIMNNWLEKFAYRVNIGASSIVFASLMILLIAFIAVGYHTIKSSLQNPVDVIKYE
jgi:putative ABC transport system permease protein